ncbi:YbaB/EbfC family nucleoid-associated protein [Lentzea guizhouensis]|nr:YbaB/EbfC family nucleoid-associated protein [Lentzea guizhouensis]
MSTTETSTTGTPPVARTSFAWRGRFLRLHFYAGVLVGPFILIAALTGVLYALTPQLESWVYSDQLRVPASSQQLPLSDQVRAAMATSPAGDLVAVRPAPEPGDTTRVLFAEEGLGESERRAVFVDPGTGAVTGDLVVYGSSGVLPLRTTLDQLHRNLMLGEPGRLYSELAASWLWVIALGGLVLWLTRAGGSKRIRRHGLLGVWVLAGALFLSATGLTWSAHAGENIGTLRQAFGWSTPSLQVPSGGDHSGHGEHTSAPASDPADIDTVLAAARAWGIDAGKVEIGLPASGVWKVAEIEKGLASHGDSVAVQDGTVVSSVRFAYFPFMAKMTRWGIDAHMGVLFGWPNQLLLLLIGDWLVALVVMGYRMWWRRRPTRGFDRPAPRGQWREAPPVALVGLGPARSWSGGSRRCSGSAWWWTRCWGCAARRRDRSGRRRADNAGERRRVVSCGRRTPPGDARSTVDKACLIWTFAAYLRPGAPGSLVGPHVTGGGGGELTRGARMTLIPHAIPLINDPQVGHALAARWRRARMLLLLSTGVLPVAIGLVCVVLAWINSAGQRIMPWWSAIPALAAAACAWALVSWLRRNGLSDPHSWLPATTLMTGAQVVLGVLPGSGIALRLSPGAAIAVKALCAAGVLGAGSAGWLARLAKRSLLAVPVVELGATAFPLVLASDGARVVIGTDRIDWREAGVAFARIQRVTARDDALVLHTASGAWTVPVHDAVEARDLLLRRIAWWREQTDAAAQQERERYHQLLCELNAINGRASTGPVSVTVDANGVTTGITLDAAARDHDPEVLSALLMACIGKARADARKRVQDLVLDHAA